MSRNTMSIYNVNRAYQRGAGGRGSAGSAAEAPTSRGLQTPQYAHYRLDPSHQPTALTSMTENLILKSIYVFEDLLGTGITTPTLHLSIATNEVLSILADTKTQTDNEAAWISGVSQNRLNLILRQISAIHRPGCIRSFLQCHKKRIRKLLDVGHSNSIRLPNIRLN